jgi:hypothetical protein
MDKFSIFMRELKQDVENFNEFWENGHKDAPEAFPLDLSEGDFFDQFLMYLNTQSSFSEEGE